VEQAHFSEALQGPFADALAGGGRPATEQGVDSCERQVSALAALQRLQSSVEASNDPALGLKAARCQAFGQIGIIDYLVATSATVGHAFDTLARYSNLVNDTLRIERETTDELATIYFVQPIGVMQSCQAQAARAAWDFLLGGIYSSHRATVFCRIQALECWFPYPAPDNLEEHRKTLGETTLRFSNLVPAYRFPAVCLKRSLPRADPKLHDMLCQHAERTQAWLAHGDRMIERVLKLIARRSEPRMPSLEDVAAQLDMSPRTLGRRLEFEGATYTDLVATWRKRWAVHYLSQPSPNLKAMSEQLGYSHQVGFHRAFKRWTGQTPLAYHRRLREGVLSHARPTSTHRYPNPSAQWRSL
ncbi:MAG: AraC family transcriptional regulator ligand-binding domain-containing protein, partial [Myxococcales bacterium]|nr:AraC family transcriptional regulator ligand-binding domain-containing protein [Myxococcales bacterium]